MLLIQRAQTAPANVNKSHRLAVTSLKRGKRTTRQTEATRASPPGMTSQDDSNHLMLEIHQAVPPTPAQTW